MNIYIYLWPNDGQQPSFSSSPPCGGPGGHRNKSKNPPPSRVSSEEVGSEVMGAGIEEMPLRLVFRTREGQGCGGGCSE
jgi:hypothetical protein